MLLTLFYLFSGFAPSDALAGEKVIFFVNMNYSSSELVALEEQAKKRGQELVVVPPKELNKEAEEYERKHAELERLIKKYNPDIDNAKQIQAIEEIEKSGSLPQNSTIKVPAEMIEAAFQARKKIENSEKKIGPIYDQIRDKLKELKRNKKDIDTLVLSAHSDGTNMSGETGYNLAPHELNDLAKEFPQMFKARHNLLLGCYTMTKNNRKLWREMIFQQASLIAGFSPRAPHRSDPRNIKFIHEVMDKANELDGKIIQAGRTPTKEDITKAFLALKSVTGTSAVIDYCSEVVIGRPKETMSCNEEWNLALDKAESIKEIYFDQIAPKMDPPRNTTISDLRIFYNSIQELCEIEKLTEITAEEKKARENYINEMIIGTRNLVFWWNVQKNFKFCKKNELNELQKSLRQAGISEELISMEEDTSRLDFIRSINEIKQKIRALPNKREMQRKLSSIVDPLLNLNDEIPLSWHNPSTSAERCK